MWALTAGFSTLGMRSRSSFAGRIGCAPTIDGDDGVSQLFYDGKTLVLYRPAKKEYVSIPVPDTIEGMFKEATNRMGLDFPLADFLSPAPNKAILAGVTDGRVVNDVTIDGVLSRHLTLFQPPGLELEIWLTKNEQSLPERLFITYRSIPGQPTFVATFSDWNFSVAPTDADFVFQPPEGAKQVRVEIGCAPARKSQRSCAMNKLILAGLVSTLAICRCDRRVRVVGKRIPW